MGTPNKLKIKGLFLHHSDMNWPLVWNQTDYWVIKNINIANDNSLPI